MFVLHYIGEKLKELLIENFIIECIDCTWCIVNKN